EDRKSRRRSTESRGQARVPHSSGGDSMRALLVSLLVTAALVAPAAAAPRHHARVVVHSAPVCTYNTRPQAPAIVLDRALETSGHLRADRGFDYAATLLQRAKAVLIIPRMVKAGFIIGGEGGDGVLLVRDRTHWSNPVFYSMGATSFGLQA